MTDAEWNRWQQTFRRKEGAMPQVVKKVRKAKLLLALSNAVFGAIVVGELVAGVDAVVTSSQASGRLVGAFIIAFVAAMTALYVALVAGLWKREQQTPEALLAWMERMFRASERAGWLARGGGIVACAGTAGFLAWNHAHAPGVSVLPGAGVIAFTLGLTWTMPIVVRRRLANKRAQLEAWKRELEA